VNGDKIIRCATTAAVSAVAGIAAVVSYSHVYDLGRTHGQSGTAARLWPLSVDGLILAASLLSGGLQPVARRCTRCLVESLCNTSLWV
jgi:hypothetical protein